MRKAHGLIILALLFFSYLACSEGEPIEGTTPSMSSGSYPIDIIARKKYAVRLSACMGYVLDSKFSLGILWGEGTLYLGELPCVNSATDCREVLGCFDITESSSCPDYGTVCTSDAFGKKCEFFLDHWFEKTIDCTKDRHGNTFCYPWGSDSQCNAGSCGLVTKDGECDGSTWVHCDGQNLYRFDCALAGLDCIETATSAGCGKANDPCETHRCDGTVIVGCSDTVSYVFRKYDCDLFGEHNRCDPVDGCISDYCNDPEKEAWCEGDVAFVCRPGPRTTFDCSTFRGAVCTEIPKGNSIDVACRVPGWPPQ